MGVDAMMAFTTASEINEKHFGWQLGNVFGREKFWHDPLGKYGLPEGPVTRTSNEKWTYGDVPTEGREMFAVNLCSRYYGPGYERGDANLIVGVARAIRFLVPDALVYYGGDTGEINEFNETACVELERYSWEKGSMPYVGTFWGGGDNSPTCDVCDKPMPQFMSGGGGTKGGCVCIGCGLRKVTADNGDTWRTLNHTKDMKWEDE